MKKNNCVVGTQQERNQRYFLLGAWMAQSVKPPTLHKKRNEAMEIQKRAFSTELGSKLCVYYLENVLF